MFARLTLSFDTLFGGKLLLLVAGIDGNRSAAARSHLFGLSLGKVFLARRHFHVILCSTALQQKTGMFWKTGKAAVAAHLDVAHDVCGSALSFHKAFTAGSRGHQVAFNNHFLQPATDALLVPREAQPLFYDAVLQRQLLLRGHVGHLFLVILLPGGGKQSGTVVDDALEAERIKCQVLPLRQLRKVLVTLLL